MNKLSARILFVALGCAIFSGCDDSKPVSGFTQVPLALPENIKVSVLSADVQGKINPRIEVEIDKRLTLSELQTTARFVHANNTRNSTNSTIFFYLPNQVAGAEMAWARVTAPDGEAKVLGLPVESAKNLTALPKPSGVHLGSWLDDGMGMRQTIVRREGKLVLLREFESGANERELHELKSQAGEKLRVKYRDKDYTRNGEYLVINVAGELVGYDKDGKIFTIFPVLFD